MNWLYLLSYFFGGAFLANTIPHLVSGLTGHPFQTPFAKPPGEGLSSSTVNVLWGLANAIAAWALILRVGHFHFRYAPHAGALFAGALLISLFTAKHFGKFHGGNLPA